MENPQSHPEVRKLWFIAMIVQTALGFTNGLYLYTYGPYFYEKFGGTINPANAMLLTSILLGVRQGLVALLELPTGALADAMGRAHVVVLSWIVRVLFFIGLAVIWLCQSPMSAFAWGVLASIAFAASYTFFNGAFSAWCVDILREKAPEVSFGWLASRFHSYRSFAELLGGLIAVYLYLLHAPFIGFLLAAFISFCLMGYTLVRMKESRNLRFLNQKDVQVSTVTKRIGEIIGRSAQICSKTPVLFWIVLSYGSYMFLLNVVMYLWPIYFHSVAGDKAHFGRNWALIVVISNVLCFAGSRGLVYLNHIWSKGSGIKSHLVGFRRIFIGTSFLSAIVILALSLEIGFFKSDVYLFPSAVLVVLLAYGIVTPGFDTLINAYIPIADAQYRATIMSAGSMFRSLMVLILAIPAGGTSGNTSPINWAIPAVLLLFSAVFANHFMKKAHKTMDKEIPPDEAKGEAQA